MNIMRINITADRFALWMAARASLPWESQMFGTIVPSSFAGLCLIPKQLTANQIA